MTRVHSDMAEPQASKTRGVKGRDAFLGGRQISVPQGPRDGALFWTLCIAVVGVPLVWTTSVIDAFSIPKETLFFLVVSAGMTLWSQDLKTVVTLRYPRANGDRAGLAFLALSTVSLVWAFSPALGLRNLARLLALGAFYSLLVVVLNSKRQVKLLLGLFMATAAVVAALGLFQFYDMYNYPGLGRPFLLSTLGHPNHVSNFVGVAFPLFVVVSMTSHGWRRGLAFAGTCLGFALLLVAQSRSIWLATVIAITVGGILVGFRQEWRHQVREERRALIVLAAALLLILSIFSVHNPLNRRVAVWSRAAGLAVSESGEHVTVGARWLIWKAAWLMIRDHPLLGVGFGNFAAHSSEYMAWARETSPRLDPRYRTEFFQEAHNDYLHFWAELGPVGLITFLWFFGWHLVLAYRRLTSAQVADRDALWLIGLAGSLLVFLVDALFSIPSFVLSSALASLVVTASIRRMASPGEDWSVSLGGRPSTDGPPAPTARGVPITRNAIVVASLIASLVVSAWAAAIFLADVFAHRGERAAKFGDYRTSLMWFDKAAKANPLEWRYRLARGGLYTAVFRYNEGLQSLRQAESFLKRATIAERMGVTYAGLGNVSQAEAEYHRALWYEPHNIEAWEYLLYLLVKERKFAEAENAASDGVRWNPDRGRLYLYLARAQAALGQEGKALESAQRAAEMLPSDRSAFVLLHDLALPAGRVDLAEAANRRLRAITQYETFQQLLRSGRADPEVTSYLLNAIVTDARYADPHFDLGIISQDRGMTQEAIAEFSIYLRLAPRGDRAVQTEQFIMALQHPSWLVRLLGVDWRLRS